MIPCDHVNVCPAIVVCGSGAELVSMGLSCAVLDERSVRINFARRAAPSTLTCPVPCSSSLKPAIGPAVYIKAILTIFGVSFGLICSISAATPDTIGVAIEVPLRYIRRLLLLSVMPESNCGFCVTSRFGPALESASAKISLLPGATRSGLSRLS